MPQPTATRPAVSRAPVPVRLAGPAPRGPARGGRPPRPGGPRPSNGTRPPQPGVKTEHEILFQKYFKSVGPRTYAAQVKRANNGNHFLVLTEGKRDESSGEVRKTKLFVYSEDFVEFFKLLQATAQFIKANPVPDEVKKKRDRFWAKKAMEAATPPKANPDTPPGASRR